MFRIPSKACLKGGVRRTCQVGMPSAESRLKGGLHALWSELFHFNCQTEFFLNRKSDTITKHTFVKMRSKFNSYQLAFKYLWLQRSDYAWIYVASCNCVSGTSSSQYRRLSSRSQLEAASLRSWTSNPSKFPLNLRSPNGELRGFPASLNEWPLNVCLASIIMQRKRISSFFLPFWNA